MSYCNITVGINTLEHQSKICPYFIIMTDNLNISFDPLIEKSLKKRDAYYAVIGSNLENLGFFDSVLNIVTVEPVSDKTYHFQRKTLCHEKEQTWNVLNNGKHLFENKLFDIYPSISCLNLKAGSFEYPPWIFIDNTKQGNDRFSGAEVIIIFFSNKYEAVKPLFFSPIWSKQ